MRFSTAVEMTEHRTKNVFVTGATGFVGRHVVAILVSKGYAVTALARSPAIACQLPELKGANVVEFDLADQRFPSRVPSQGTLIHCAWGDVRNHTSSRHVDEHLINSYLFIRSALAHGISKIVVTGTSWEYGEMYGPVRASAIPRPKNAYGTAKYLLYQMLRTAQQSISFTLVWARLFYIYGTNDDPKSLIGQFDRALESGERSFNMSFGEQLYDFLPIEDGAEQIAALGEAPDGIYNVCSGNPISLRRLLEERMREKNRFMELNLGFYPYRSNESIALWGADPWLAPERPTEG